MGVTRISEMLGREKSQVSRALKALAEYGLVERNRDALTYRLGWRIYALAQLAGEPRLLEEAGPRLRRLAIETQERAHFSVLQGTDVLTLLSESPGRAVEAVGWVGRVTPCVLHLRGRGAALRPRRGGARAALRRRGVHAPRAQHAGGRRRAPRADRARPRARGGPRERRVRGRSRRGRRPRARRRRRDRRGPQRLGSVVPRRGPRGGSLRGRAGRRSRTLGRGPRAPSTRTETAPRQVAERRAGEGRDRRRRSSSSATCAGPTSRPPCASACGCCSPTSRRSASPGGPRRRRSWRPPTRQRSTPATRRPRCSTGGALGAVGAAWCNGVLANVLDYDDGHRLTKGHPGAVVIPAALAAAQLADATAEELLVAVVVGYEIAIRAGVALHARDDGYHASGAWGGLGAAAAAVAAARPGREPRSTTRIGLAEYHAPIAHIMRSVAQPAMTKDACAWGASVGVSSALMAAGGFTAVRRGLPRRGRGRPRQRPGGSRSSTSRRTPAAAGRRARSARRSRRAGASDSRRTTSRRSRSRRSPPPTRSPRSCPRPPRRRSTTSSGRSRPLSPRGGFTVADVLGPWGDPGLDGPHPGGHRPVAHGRVPGAAPDRGGDRAARRPAPRRRAARGRAASRAPTTGPRSSPRRSPSTSIPTATSPDPPLTASGAATPAELLALLCDPVASPARA